jgi:hypothetical protein
MSAKLRFTMEESLKLAEWGKANVEYMRRNPRNNVRRKIKNDTGMEIGNTKLKELAEMFNIVKTHGGKRPAGKNFVRLLRDLHVVAVAVKHLIEFQDETFITDGNPDVDRLNKNLAASGVKLRAVVQGLEALCSRVAEEPTG